MAHGNILCAYVKDAKPRFNTTFRLDGTCATFSVFFLFPSLTFSYFICFSFSFFLKVDVESVEKGNYENPLYDIVHLYCILMLFLACSFIFFRN